MNKKILAYVTSGMLLLGGAGGLSAAWAQNAPVKAAPAAVAQEQRQEQPSYRASIQVADPQDKNKEQAKDAPDEAAEAAALEGKAKITPAQAQAAALAAVPGTALKTELDNENGNLVYSVEVKTAQGVKDIKVDAGDGKVLAQENAGDEEEGGQAKDGAAASETDNGPDHDQVQEEVEE
ncbi:MAG: PepSY domain-containing protein [Desulfotomaculales bacterium]